MLNSPLKWTAILVGVAGCMPTGIQIMPVPTDRSLKEFQLQRDRGWPLDKIAVVDVNGVLMNGRRGGLTGRGEHGVSLVVEKLEAAREDRAVKAVVLRINSPGGSVTASEILYEELRRFRDSGKPVVAMFMDVAASGGYYIACACDEILAHRGSVTGSIGVVMQTFNLSGTMTKLGISSEAIKSGARKDAGSPLRPMEPEERAIFQAMIDEMYGRFVEVVDAGRPNLSLAEVRALADGRVYTAQQALEAGLVDGIVTLPQAVERAKQRAGVRRCRVVTYQRPLSWHPNIYARSPVGRADAPALIHVDLPEWLTPGAPRFMYLWMP